MVQLMIYLGLAKSDTGPFVILRRNRGGLLRRPQAGGIVITADGRADWAGSLELRDEPINEHAMRNTARVMIDVRPTCSASSRPRTGRRSPPSIEEIIVAMGGKPFHHVMVIDGNDDRGIDVGLMTRTDFPIGPMRSHVDDRLPNGETVFSRDCPEFTVTTAAGARLVVLVNHFKSKGFGSQSTSNSRRRAQAERVKAIYEQLVADGVELVAVVGDFNDTPDSAPLKPLVKDTDLKDAFTHPSFKDGGFPGTFGLCNASNKIDYLLLSPKLFARVQAGGVFRKGMWPGSRPRRWEVYAEVSRPVEAGSDHAAIWVDVNV